MKPPQTVGGGGGKKREACVHSARTAQAQRAQRGHDRKKLGFFATIGNILAYTDYTTPPQRWTA